MSQKCDLLLDYFNGHLTDKEREEFEQHAAACPECQEELKELQEVLGDMAFLSEPVTPPVEMKDRILGNVFAEEEVEPVSLENPTPVTGPTPLRKKSAHKSKPWLTGLLAASLILSLLGNGYFLMQDEKEGATDDQELVQPDSIVTLEPSEAGGSGFAALFKQEQALSVMIQTQELPELKGTEVYQVWLLKDGAPIPAGDFTVDENGKGYVLYKVDPAENKDWDTIAITLEPQKGNQLPEGSILLSAGL